MSSRAPTYVIPSAARNLLFRLSVDGCRLKYDRWRSPNCVKNDSWRSPTCVKNDRWQSPTCVKNDRWQSPNCVKNDRWQSPNCHLITHFAAISESPLRTMSSCAPNLCHPALPIYVILREVAGSPPNPMSLHLQNPYQTSVASDSHRHPCDHYHSISLFNNLIITCGLDRVTDKLIGVAGHLDIQRAYPP